MNFESRYQHSSKQLNKLKELREKKEISVSESLFLATEAIQHGQPYALSLIDCLLSQFHKKEIQDFLFSLKLQCEFIESIQHWPMVKANPNTLKKLYELNGYQFIKGSKHPSKLIIVFTTMYNNFYMSNAVLAAFLLQFGISILILKDATRFNYLKGVQGLGDDLSKVANKIQLIIDQEGIKEVIIAGFSSGGYASLLLSCLVPCNRYLGFSIRSDLSEHSALAPPKFFLSEVRELLDKRWLINMRERLTTAAIDCRKEIYVGKDNTEDMRHADNLRGLPDVHLHELPCGHITIAPLMQTGDLTRIFHNIIFET
ncbi:alpha/beta fold hydrolase [Polynucleobacter asymbioticus]|jgi:hypothetical protein|uniref:Uncharacterized protein n=1 Tax=Polynucleobacter asymbioticus TaxID=576611 RepID=A0AAC9NI86_9BURK|nr:hypothetical protein [Polynucleobacter asymbioticus]APB98208.1 hypothetical protein A4F89_02075 [Polynucleobacter asymbioticus]APC00494.1 hypothetical protein AOC25_02080 [Polynucleobacter asymbioticus]